MFTGRDEELELIEEKYCSKRSELIVIYGRRRVGKSTLIQQFLRGKNCTYVFEGLENENTPKQIKYFSHLLQQQTKDSFFDGVTIKSWKAILDYMTREIVEKIEKSVIVFDELQWLAVGQTSLISLLKFYWDNHWKQHNVKFILCGSMASFMVNKVINSKALYGRINLQILLDPLDPNEAALLFKKKRSKEEILKYFLVLGCIPKYLEEINLNRSFNQNINQLCFNKNALMLDEYEKVFYSQFKEAKNYLAIVEVIQEKALTLSEIAKAAKIPLGGSINSYLQTLEKAQIISSFVSIDMKYNTKFVKYRLLDEFLAFFYKYMKPNRRIIEKHKDSKRKLFEDLCESRWDSWLGFAFERFCLRNAIYLAERMGFADRVIDFAPLFARNDTKFQIDLLYRRSDKTIVLCEIKYQNKPIGAQVIADVEKKSQLYLPKLASGYALEKALISVSGADEHVKKSEYFHYILSLDNII